MKHQVKNTNFWIVIFTDIVLLCGAYFLAYLIRFEGHIAGPQLVNIKTVLPFYIPLKLLVFSFFGLYRGMWRYTGLIDLMNIVKACAVVAFVALGGLLLVNRFEGFSRSVFVIDALLTFLMISGVRVALRLYYHQPIHFIANFQETLGKASHKKLLIIGAGDAAEKIVREIHDNRALPYTVIGFLDDHPSKIGKRIHGIPVLGATAELHEFVFKAKPHEILIAVPSASRDQIGRFVELCRTSGIPYKTLPGLGELINGGLSIKSIRDVSYKDLLGRPPVRLELEQIDNIISGKCVLMTGAGGSIGSELCRQILRFHPGKIILYDASEENLYSIEMEILHEYGFSNYVTVLGKVQDRDLLGHVFSHYKPDIVFHAAAYKHVPMVERNPWEAIYNNIFATLRLIKVSIQHDVERFILVSTDKAVRPTNVMGASKRMAEKLLLAHNKGSCRTRFMAVRFGNVLGSSGSVIPLFRRQIELGGPVTVTDPNITRYFMSIEEAAQLILQAATMGEGGEIFILEMGTPVRIAQMARDLIRLCGKEPDIEIEIKYTGLRPGEKLYEELITEGEGIVSTKHEKILVLRGNGCNLEDMEHPLTKLKFLAKAHDSNGIKEVLKEIVPEYRPGTSEAILPSILIRKIEQEN
ncbi:MAG: polysaccharide biosynthesis protein [Proteobacteria bacterium]|nr:polysaccharide biosynthesis protein [Pseudomonadota bacterium]